MLIYCMKCKRKTQTLNAKTVKSAKTSRVVGTCAICGSKKSQFIKRK